MAGIGPGGKPGDDVELSEELADDLVGVGFGAESIELSNDFYQCLLDVVNRALRVKLALLLQIALGISTLVLIVPVWLGALHQAGALVVLTFALYLSHALRQTAQRN